jgi:beta-mannosidase
VTVQDAIKITSWRLKDFAVGHGEKGRAFDADLTDSDWIDIPAPGDFYLALHAAGRIPDPFGDRTEQDCAWVKDKEWWQRADFEAPHVTADQRLILTFEGLDTFAAVWLNGEKIGSSDNMFRAATFDIGAHVRRGANRLAVCFTPTSTAVIDKVMPVWSIIADPITETKRNFVRKAQFGWGWDWGPRLPTVGIWKPVKLRVETIAALHMVKFTTLELSGSRERARVSVEVAASPAAVKLTAEITLTSPDGAVVVERTVDLPADGATVEFQIADPKLWWTPELGAPNLYKLKVVLKADGAPIDHRILNVGIRTIILDQSPDPDEPDSSFFRFILNGISIFARGVCWIPASSFVGAVDEAHYRKLLDMAADANMNMIRVWGGGVYEHDSFYDLCDERGLLVWQDFMFACAPYPEHELAFVENVRAEVRHQIERLRHHACLALWCGNNECHAVQGFMNRLTKQNEPLLGALYYDEIMPEEIARLDPTTAYWPSSPFGGPVENSHNSMLMGDVHDWTVWHGLPPTPRDRAVGGFDHSPEGIAYTRYAEDMARFIGEYGIQASPVMETLKRALPEDQRELGSPALLNRIKDRPKDKVDAMILPVTGMPETLEQYVDFTQITQAEGLKFGVEHFRRRTPHCSGSLIWQYNDCWPGISWSLVDYYGFGKASYFYVKRAYAPVMASFKALDDGAVELWVTNDTLNTAEDEAVIALTDFSGKTIWSEAIAVKAPPTYSGVVWRAPGDKVAPDPGHILTVRSVADALLENRHFFAPIKDLTRDRNVQPSVKIEQRGAHELAVHIEAPSYLYFTHLLVPFEETRFSDNYFDLRACQSRTIRVTNAARELNADDVTVRCC